MKKNAQDTPRQLRNAMTVRDLIDELKDANPDALVIFGCDYGDHVHTEQALPVTTVDELDSYEELSDSGYSTSGLAVKEWDDEDVDGADDACHERGFRNVIILR